jgi:hypothetical protein
MTTFQGDANGVFAAPAGGVTSGVGSNFFTWGVGQPDVSSLRFDGTSFSVTTPTGYVLGPVAQAGRPTFSIGTLTYHNGTIASGTGSSGVRLDTTVRLTAPVAAGPTTFPAQLALINTPNSADPVSSADIVNLPGTLPPVVVTTAGGLPISVEPVAFGNPSTGGFTRVSNFFVLEGASASAQLFARIASPCEPIVRGAVTPVASGTVMSASFTPNFGLSLMEAAGLCGYDHFDYYQVVTNDPNPPASKNAPTVPLTVPYVDPPLGGYAYQPAGDDNLPFYWNAAELATNTTATTVSFSDAPAEPSLTAGQFLGFTTTLVGVFPDNTWDALYAWNWISDFNGTVGGASVRENTLPVDPGSGTGGVTLLETDLNVQDLLPGVRALMQRDGAQNLEILQVAPAPATLWLLLVGLAAAALTSRLAAQRRR